MKWNVICQIPGVLKGKDLCKKQDGTFFYYHFWVLNYLQNPGSVAPATNSRLSPLPPEPAGFNYGLGTTVDIPIDSAAVGLNPNVGILVMKIWFLLSNFSFLNLGFEKERKGTPS